MGSRIRAWVARCWSVKVSSLWTSRSAWTQHRACSPTANWPASSLTITVPGSRPWALMAPQSAPSVATRAGPTLPSIPRMPSRSRCACQAAWSGKARSGCPARRATTGPAGQGPLAHVGQRLGIDHVVRMAGPQQPKEVQPALAGRGAEPGEVVVADPRAAAVRRPVPRPGVVHRDPGGTRQPGPRHVTTLVQEAPLIPARQAHDLPLGDGDPDRAQLRDQARHGRLPLMVLGQHVAPEFGAEVAIDPAGQGGHEDRKSVV